MTTAAVNKEPIYYDPFDYEIDRDPYPIWSRMRNSQPVYWNDRYDFYALSRFEDVWTGYHDTGTFSSSHGVQLETLDSPVPFPSMIFMDPPDHESLRRLVNRAFTPRRVRDLESSIFDLVNGYLDPFIGESQFDYVEQFGGLLPPIVIGAMLGVPVAERDMLRHWFDEMMHREEGASGPSEKVIAAGTAIYEYAAKMIAERRRSPQDDLMTDLLEAEIEDENGSIRKLDDTEVVSFITLLAGAGVETVARLLSFAAVVLARNPDQRAALVEDPSLIANGIEELLRYEAPSPVNGRWTTRPFTVHGITIPAESKVLLLNGSANRDANEFDNPDQFDVRRSIKRHITFGYGAHFCLGAALARMEARFALEGTLKRFPTWEIDDSELIPVHTSTVRGFKSVPIHF
jgi:cytochrome P450